MNFVEYTETSTSLHCIDCRITLERFRSHARTLSHCAHTRRDCEQPPSAVHISRTMTPIYNALVDLALSESPNISAVAKAYGTHPSTLSRRWRGRSTSKAIALSNRRFLNNRQEKSLVDYINELSGRSAAPTPPSPVSSSSASSYPAPPPLGCHPRLLTRHDLLAPVD